MSALASRLDDGFALPARNAPGVHLFGALARRSAFGFDGHEPDRFSAGGRGTSPPQAFASCMGEFAERLSTLEMDGDPLVAEQPDIAGFEADPKWLLRGLGSDDDPDLADLETVQARCLHDGSPVGLPCELVLQRLPSRRRFPRRPDSTGVAAGPTPEAATAAALLELVERDAIALWWFAGQPAGRLDPETERWEALLRLVASVRHPASPRRFWFLDLTGDLGIPVLACCSSEADGRAVVAGFAADPTRETAAIRAFLEMCQMEVAQELAMLKAQARDEADLPPADRVWVDRHRKMSTSAFPALEGADRPGRAEASPTGPSARPALLWLRKRLRDTGLRAYAVDLTRKQLGIPVVRVVVPGLQSTRPDWVTPRLETAAAAAGVDLPQRLSGLAPI